MSAPRKRRVLFLYLRTGGGHLAPARAVARAIAEGHGEEIEPVLVDALDGGSAFARAVLEDGYRRLQSHAIWLYEALYATNKFRPIARFNCWLAALFLRPAVRRHIDEARPDIIVVVHFFLVRPVFDLVGRRGGGPPVVTLVTDPYTAHPMWFLEPLQHLIVCSDRLRGDLLRGGIDPARVAVAPFPVEDRYMRPMTAAEKSGARARLGIPEGRRLVLLLGGGDGLPRGAALLRALLASGLDASVVMVCGRNERLRRDALAVAAEYPRAGAVVHGFVDFVYDLLNVADVVIAKPGASTMMQCALLGVRAVITDYMWEQEKGNVDAIRERGWGVFEPRISRVAAAVSRQLALPPGAPAEDLRGGAHSIAALIAATACERVHPQS